MSEIISLSPSDLEVAICKTLNANKVPMIKSSPGLGKSQIVKQIADKYKLILIDERLSQYDPTDLNGFPTIKGERSGYNPPETIPLESDKVPNGYNGWLLFLDEINSAPSGVQAAAYKLILDRMIGKHKLNEHVYIIAAGNLETDRAIVNRSGTAMQSRLIHFINLKVSKKDWLNWANENNIDYKITSFISFRPDILHNFDPKHTDSTYPCPRTWEFLSDLIKDEPDLDTDISRAIAAGTVGQGAAIEFNSFIKIINDLPKIEQIIANPTNIPVPSLPQILYAITGMLAVEMTESNLDKLEKYISRLPIEFQILTWRSAIKRKPELMTTQIVKNWLRDNSRRFSYAKF